MRVSMEGGAGNLILQFHPEEEDLLKPNDKFRMASNKCFFTLPRGISPDSIHPDHLGLATIMLCAPFVRGRLILPRPISERFFEATRVFSKFVVEPYNSTVEPYFPSEYSRPALSFSGGVDSVSALAMMPEETVCVFLERPLPKRGRSLYNKEAPLEICKKLIDSGREVHVIPSDLEYLRDPVGFPVDVANSAPAVLVSELMNFNSIAFGTILESAYGIGHKKYRHYPVGSHNRTWGSLFEGAGIPLNLVVAGFSEVATSKLMIEHPLGEFSQSCIRGGWGSPCRNCWKCFRKILLDKVLRGEQLSDVLLDELFEINEARMHLMQMPIKHENILTWITSRYHGKHEIMLLLKERVRGGEFSLDWLERWNSESKEIVHESCIDSLQRGVLEFFEEMDDGMSHEMKDWDMNEMIESEKYGILHNKLVELLK